MLNLGRTAYADARRLQLELHAARRRDEIPDTLVLTEHEPVITTGRGADFRHLRVDRERLAALGIETIAVERGGDITYHGPGQLVAYPVLDLRTFGRDIHAYMRGLEATALLLLRSYGIEPERRPGQPGLFTRAGKIASVGVFVSGWVSMHGLAVNLSLNQEHAGLIWPCGLADTRFSSVEIENGRVVPFDEAAARYVGVFARTFDRKIVTSAMPR